MRRVLPYIILSAAFTLLLGGCIPEKLETRFDEDGIVLYFNPGSSVPLTKAYTSSVTAYNENKINSVDIFFYPEGQGATTSNAIYSVIGRAVEQVEGNDNLYKTTIRLNSTQTESIFGGVTNGTCKVFVIANASLSYSDTSIPALKQQLIERDFSTQTIQGSFVMYSNDGGSETDEEGYTVTLSDGNAFGKIPMLRVAAKAQLFFKVIESIEDPNTHLTWKPDLKHMKVYLVNGMKRARINAPYAPSNDGSDYFDYPERDVTDYSLAAASTTEEAVYTEISDAGFGSYKYSCEPFYSYPCSWKDIHDHATQYIIDIPWYIDAEGAAPPASRYYQLSANLVDSWFLRNRYYRSFVEIKTLGGADKTQSVDIQECTYSITPWFMEGAGVESSGVPVVGTFESQSYLVVEPTRVILNNENYAEFDYLSSSTLDDANTKVLEVRYYDYSAGNKEQIIRKTDSEIASDANTNSSAISVDISSGKVKVTHNLYNDNGAQKIFVQYYIKVRIQNGDGLHEDVEIYQYPPLYVLMKNGDNAFVDGYFRHVQKTGGGAPITNAYAFPSGNGFYGYYRSASYFRGKGNSYNTPDGYGYVGINTGTSNTDNDGRYIYFVFTPYGDLYATPGTGGGLSLYDIIGLKLSAFSESYNSYTVGVNFLDGTRVEEPVPYRIGDPRTPNDFTTNPKLVNYLTGMSFRETVVTNRTQRYNITTEPWGDKADAVKIGTTDHNANSLIAPYILISSSYIGLSAASGYGVTYEQAKKRCATYQEGGYPAGRWRLPTEAEIMYIVERQKDGTIPVLMNVDLSNGYYWASSGFYFINGELHESRDGNEDGACRCVYDAWYWGDDPVAEAAYTYKPMP